MTLLAFVIGSAASSCSKDDTDEPNTLPEPNAKGIVINCSVGGQNWWNSELWINDYVILCEIEEGSWEAPELGNRSISYMPFSLELVDQYFCDLWGISADKLENHKDYNFVLNNRYKYKYIAFRHNFVYMFNRISGINY